MRGPRAWLVLAWSLVGAWSLRIAARVFEESPMERIPRTLNGYLAWLGTLTSEQLAAVHLASDWFATVHARDMDALYALLMVLEERIHRIEAQRQVHGDD